MKKKFLSIILVVIALSNILVISASANNTKLVALTFDDGPNAKITPGLLDALKERNVKVTFFLVGNMLDQNRELAQRAHDEGHQLANHTRSHPYLTKCSADQIRNQLGYVDNILAEITGETNFKMRAPYGAVGSTLKNLQITPIILWSVDPGNGNMSASEATMKANLLKQVKDGSIIILHDSTQKNVNVALYAIDTLRAQGYEFVTVDELFRLKGVTPVNGQVYYSVDTGVETLYDESRLTEHWAWEYISAVQQDGIMQGDGEGFKPNNFMSRAMAATILKRMDDCLNALASPITDPLEEGSGETAAPSSFTDVEPGSWYADAVEWAAANGYVNGYGDGRFIPEGNITKEQFYTILARYASDALSAADKTSAPVSYIDDDKISDWARDNVNSFRASGFSSKNDPEIFRPGDFITRAEAAELIEYVMGLKQKFSPVAGSTGGSDWTLQCFLIGDSFLLNTYLIVNRNKADSSDENTEKPGDGLALI